ncbi:glycosyltransferase family 2 protein [Vibrio ouci]|uniref:Glycosyltransferase family 2 protein n=1 Tax=Vibrio ouci TaxID=2499078 RepID=A0A4Y8WKM1_9VIBR|nr:glycosyltransferase family A protein [Vibrio ouci]TFH93145.1 glycosyltransferase family 2 protein [Vibrio ouci]
MPNFSVIIPTYNRLSLLKASVESVLKQTMADFEIIIVNDHSVPIVPNTFSDQRVSVINSCLGRGPAFARNIGIQAAKGHYISFLDDDDHCHPEFLRKTWRALAPTDSQIGMSWTGAKFFNGDQVTRVYAPTISEDDDQALLDEFLSIGTGFGVTFKKECLSHTGLFDDQYRYIEDTELFIRALSHGYLPLHIPDLLVNILDHSNERQTNTENYAKRIAECQQLIEANGHFFTRNPRMKAQLHWTIKDLETQIATALFA